MRRIAILGATGSIGTQALDIVRGHPDRFSAVALTAGQNAEKLFALAREFHPEVCGLAVEPDRIPDDLADIQWVFGADCNEQILAGCRAQDALCAIVGIAGLPAVLRALDACERVLLANKEALVTGGYIVTEKAKRLQKQILPVDSEHSAIFQCLRQAMGNRPERLILTCSGGALRQMSASEIENATVSQVLTHPTWRMGGKITVDCASLMNKGLEIIEAHHLFGMPGEKIEVVIHPQSVIHSMVEFADGGILAQLGTPDMRGPIGYAMGDPDRIPYGGRRLDFAAIGSLSFSSPDRTRFPCLRYAEQALKDGGDRPAVLNGANEEAVGAFLRGEIVFGDIPRAVEYALSHIEQTGIKNVEEVYAADARARRAAKTYLNRSSEASHVHLAE